MWDLIVSVPGHCFFFYFSHQQRNDIRGLAAKYKTFVANAHKK